MAGQAVRFIDLPADAGDRLWPFRACAGAARPARTAARRRIGARRWRANSSMPRNLTSAPPARPLSRRSLPNATQVLPRHDACIDEFADQHASGADGQVQRVARTFGLLAAAGELGDRVWHIPVARWRGKREPPASASRIGSADRGGSGAAEIEAAISHLRATIERDGASRFQRPGASETVHQRLGFIRENEGDTEYLIPRESWKALMAGRDARRIARELAARGILKRDFEGRPDPKERLPGHKNTQRVYVVRHSALFADGGEDA